MKKTFKNVIAIILAITGVIIIAYPSLQRTAYQAEVDKAYEEFMKKYKPDESPEKAIKSIENGVKVDYRTTELYKEMVKYNNTIYNEKQHLLTDPWSYEQASVNLKKYGYSNLGYISIPSLKLKLPIYLGASELNMKRGATHLSQTSLPIGGINNNSVICAHRRWVPAKMFNDLPKIKIGAKIRVTNMWYSIDYQVVATETIRAYEIDKIKIQENKDMLTLFTCTYYGTRKDRFVVYCERI